MGRNGMTPDHIWYATKTAGMFREGRYYTTRQLGVLGRMARKVGYLVLADPPVSRTKPARKAVRPRKGAAPKVTQEPDDGSPVV
jgi:hypothetical protein